MDAYTGAISPPGMYVRALYDYEADDATSLSFRQGEIIQVLTQLESGWWDGVINNTRGWFPSNYCSLIAPPEARRLDQGLDITPFGRGPSDLDGDSEGEYEEDQYNNPRYLIGSPQQYQDGAMGPELEQSLKDHEEAAFWIPQATADGRLFYFNTLTGVSTMELPLESPVSATETGPKAGANAFAMRQPQPPAGLVRNGFTRDEDTDFEQSASEAEDVTGSKGLIARKRQSQLSNGASPATSIESFSHLKTHQPSKNSFSQAEQLLHPAPNFYFDDTQAVPLTWDRLLEDMRRSVGRYRQAVTMRDRAEYVRRAEDVSDHLRMLLAAGSGTTDNHCGIPSIISSNKALYPHFRDMMSKFSKLVLNSHIAAGDFATPDAHLKCLQDAEGVLNGAHGFVDVARQQRGEEIPRLFPGFISRSATGGSWQNNGFTVAGSPNLGPPLRADDQESAVEPNKPLAANVVAQMDDLRLSIQDGVIRLQERLVVKDSVIGQNAHRKLAVSLSDAAQKILTLYQPWMTTLETLNLSLTAAQASTTFNFDFSMQKQRVYTYLAELIIAVQSVAAPLADEWASQRGEPLEERLRRVQVVLESLATATISINESLQQYLLLSTVNQSPSLASEPPSSRGASSTGRPSKDIARSLLGDISAAISPTEPTGMYLNSENSKVKKFFGEVPVTTTQTSDDVPSYLHLDHEGEVQYEQKKDDVAPPIKGGTLTGLVEQLTRHDRYDAPFKVTFLLTYQSFTTASELFEHLIRRWSIQPPPGLSEEQLRIWTEKKQGPIRFRIVNVLKSWFDTYWMEGNDAASMNLTHRVYSFAKDTVATSSTPGAKPLMTVIEQRLRGEDTSIKRLVPNANNDAPNPILPKNMKKFKFTDIDPLEFARQLTIVESRLYHKIKPYECLNKVWQKKVNPDEPDPAANVRGLILHSNRLTNWVAEMILQPNEPKKRAAVVKHFVQVADKCYVMNNFSTLTSIISALGTAPIHRLNRSWKETSRTTMITLEKLRKVMGSTKNFAEYRESLHNANPPCIPFFGVYLTDLTFIEDGIPSKIKKTDLINFAKRTKTAEVIREIQTYQSAHYNFKAVPDLQDHILSAMQNAGDVQEMYERSLQVEPREREDEKIARLLSESGFL